MIFMRILGLFRVLIAMPAAPLGDADPSLAP